MALGSLWAKKKTKKEVVMPNFEDMVDEIVVPDIYKLELDLHDDALDQHEKLSEELGITNHLKSARDTKTRTRDHKIRTQEFLQFLKDNDVKVYNEEKVNVFLNTIFEHWGWLRLIEKQGSRYNGKTAFAKELDEWRSDSPEQKEEKRVDTNGYLDNENTYPKEVPLRTLILVKTIKDKYQDACFFVSHEAIPKPDPFLYVNYNGNGYIIDHWDEPTFKD